MRVDVCNRQKALKARAADVRHVVRTTLHRHGRDAELSVAIVGDSEMAALNARFLGHEGPTDVLSFPYGDEGGVLTGEVVVNAEMAVREAAKRAHSAEDELMLYIVHGVLHLLGYNDLTPAERRRMRAAERAALDAVGRQTQ